MSNKLEVLRDDITKLINGKSLDEVIENLQELRNHSYGCEVIRLKVNVNLEPCALVYDVVNEIPSNAVIGRNPELKKDVNSELKDYKRLPTKDFPIFYAGGLPRNFFMDTSYFKEVYNISLNADSEMTLLTKIKKYIKNTRDRVFIKYGEGDNDVVPDGVIAGFTIINLDSITSDKLEIRVFNPVHIKYLIGKHGSIAKDLVKQINGELGYDRVNYVKFLEV